MKKTNRTDINYEKFDLDVLYMYADLIENLMCEQEFIAQKTNFKTFAFDDKENELVAFDMKYIIENNYCRSRTAWLKIIDDGDIVIEDNKENLKNAIDLLKRIYRESGGQKTFHKASPSTIKLIFNYYRLYNNPEFDIDKIIADNVSRDNKKSSNGGLVMELTLPGKPPIIFHLDEYPDIDIIDSTFAKERAVSLIEMFKHSLFRNKVMIKGRYEHVFAYITPNIANLSLDNNIDKGYYILFIALVGNDRGINVGNIICDVKFASDVTKFEFKENIFENICTASSRINEYILDIFNNTNHQQDRKNFIERLKNA